MDEAKSIPILWWLSDTQDRIQSSELGSGGMFIPNTHISHIKNFP